MGLYKKGVIITSKDEYKKIDRGTPLTSEEVAAVDDDSREATLIAREDSRKSDAEKLREARHRMWQLLRPE
ncbi:MAG: hypothetical protein K6G36_00115 [Candidatus Saccharibacteria bacterium]|nr:hypothetical protein [Candidatus Saccharibacteria bacterium]